MNKILYFVMCGLIAMPAMAASPAGQARRSMQTQMVTNAPRRATTASTNQITAMASAANSTASDTTSENKSSARVEPVTDTKTVDTREKEKNACINNNIGIGNTFVWASRYSNRDNYATMVEDTENPENNTCFVRVEVKSTDNRVSTSDIPAKYFEWGQNITCGAWADEGTLKQRILDAKKTARTWATVGGAVGGAGVGVGIMELFGNKLIGGKVQGQKNLSEDKLLKSQLLTLKEKNPTQYTEFKNNLSDLVKECQKDIWTDKTRPTACTEYDFESILNAMK
ncbi:MAG TPA: hypothetical protein DD611_00890 [Alphaproteobacteria bacterium]|mgnify:CR=1 FL=1|nr:hypothetical protein [Alphaproteobacteria bacterium]HBS76247.1 hypothetical protein [Alphaproteobacteria bacterium]